jgi:hypothetical protein
MEIVGAQSFLIHAAMVGSIQREGSQSADFPAVAKATASTDLLGPWRPDVGPPKKESA